MKPGGDEVRLLFIVKEELNSSKKKKVRKKGNKSIRGRREEPEKQSR